MVQSTQRFPARIPSANNSTLAVLGLVADVGGTHIRFGIASWRGS